MTGSNTFILLLLTLAIVIVLLIVLWRMAQKIAQVNKQLAVTQTAKQSDADVAALQNTQLTSENQHLQQQLQAHTQQNADLSERLETLIKEHAQVREQLVLAESQRDSQKQANAEQLLQLKQSRAEFEAFIKQYADASMQQKSEHLTSANKQQLDLLLKPLRDQINDFRQRVDHVYSQEAQDKRSLMEQISQLKTLNNQLSADATNLTKALKGDNKIQGNWGEMVLEKVLEQSGLRKGHEYHAQMGLKQEQSKTKLKPDVVVHLPDNKDVIIDAKVSLVAYDTYLSAEDDTTKANALQDHLRSLKNHISNLSGKSYESLEGVRSLDYVLLFVPVESAYMLALQSDKGEALLFDAMQRNIMVVSPATLLMVLRTIHNIWRYEHQSQNAQEMAKQAEGMYQKLVGFITSMDNVGKHLKQTQTAYEQAMDRLKLGRGNLITRAQKVASLGGIKPKQPMDESLVQQAQESHQTASTLPHDDQAGE